MSDVQLEEETWTDGKFRYVLSEPIKTDTGEVSEVILREPTGEDLLQVGNPVVLNRFAEPMTVTIKDREMAAMISRLSGILPPFMGRMKPIDIVVLGEALTLFFLPLRRKTSKTSASNSGSSSTAAPTSS